MVWPDGGGFLLLVAIAIGLRWAGGRLLPLIMPSSRLASLGAGLLGGLGGHFLGGWLWPEAPRLGVLHLPLTLGGVILFIVLLGLVPFLRIFLGKTPF